MKKEIGLIILGVIALGAALYFLVFKKKATIQPSPENTVIGGDPSTWSPFESPQREDVIYHNVVGEIPARPTTEYIGEQVAPIVTVQQGTGFKQIALDELPKGSYIDGSQVIHVPVETTNQTLIANNPALGIINEGAIIGTTPYTSSSLDAKGIPNDYSWVSPALRATNIDPAILHQAPYPGAANSWIVTVGADGRAYAREEHNYMDAVFVATPTGWQLFSGTVPQEAPIGAYGDVHKTPYGNVYSQEYWNKYGGQVLAGVFD